MQTQAQKAHQRRQSIRKLMGLETISLIEAALLVATLNWWSE